MLHSWRARSAAPVCLSFSKVLGAFCGGAEGLKCVHGVCTFYLLFCSTAALSWVCYVGTLPGVPCRLQLSARHWPGYC